MITYKEQFDKITRAYFENKLQPLKSCACFIGNLLNGNDDWRFIREAYRLEHVPGRWFVTDSCANHFDFDLGVSAIQRESNGIYTHDDIMDMERNFLNVWARGGETEQSLYDAMSSTLDMLMKIHEEKGEVIGLKPEFTKRNVQQLA